MNSSDNHDASAPHLEKIRASISSGSLDTAESMVDRLLAESASDAFGWDLRGLIAHLRGDPRMARSHTRRAIRLREDVPDFHEHMALYLRLLGRTEEAIHSVQRALELLEGGGPPSPERCAALHDFWGHLARDGGDIDASVMHHEIACAGHPKGVEFLSNLAIACADHPERADDALEMIRRATRRAPTRADLHFNHAKIEVKVGAEDEAIRALDRTLSLDPRHVGATMELASLHERAGRREAAERRLTALLDACADAHDIRFNRGLLLLRHQRWEDGFLDFEARYDMPDIPTAAIETPRWVHHRDPLPAARCLPSMRDIRGRHLLLVAEQGLGDTLQFSRFCKLVRRDHEPASITLQVHPRLLPLLAALPGVDTVVSLKAPTPAHDVWTGLMSLPLLSGAAARAEFHHPPCFEAANMRREIWRDRLPVRRSRRVAIAWQGNPSYAGDAERSIPLAHFIPLLSNVEGLDLISLQAGDGLDQLDSYIDTDGLHILDGPLDADGAFLDSSAILSACDLLLSSDTSIVHLAASMGVPTWVPTAYAPDWRWAGHGTSSPWYDAVRLFRQPTAGDWSAVFRQITSALQELPP